MTDTPSPVEPEVGATAGRLMGPMERYLRDSSDTRLGLEVAREVDAELTEAREALNRALEGSSIAESGRLNALERVKVLTEALTDLLVRVRHSHMIDHWKDYDADWHAVLRAEQALASALHEGEVTT